MLTHIVFETDADCAMGDAVMAGLKISFRKHCTGMNFAVVPAYVPLYNCGVADAVVDTARVAAEYLLHHPEPTTCIYLSPRTLKVGTRDITSTIFIVNDRERLRAARIQVMHEEALRSTVSSMLNPVMAEVRERLFPNRPSSEDEQFAETVSRAICGGYLQAHALLSPAVGHA